MAIARTSDLWWKNAVVYCLDVETFLDWDGDGVGDFTGLTERVDYLAGIGVSCLWLMPFYPSPGKDDGYDVSDLYGVNPKLGSFGDFVVFLRTAKDRGLRVIIDLVVNHTSDQHPWFRAARASRASAYRDYYVWRDEPAEEPATEVVFPDAEDSIWSFDKRAGQWYLHHFYRHQPDLNVGNPAVREEIAKTVGFWLELGVDGFRIDAVPFLLETGGILGEQTSHCHQLMKELRAFISRRRGDAVLLGEVNLPPRQLARFFGDEDGDEIHLLFNFPVMQAVYLALATEDVGPVGRAMSRLPEIPPDSQWANFLRNHDELTLDQLTDAQRKKVFAAFGPDEGMQLFGRGLRRRLPPMLDGDQARLRMAYSLLLSMPGTPVLFYGEEIGMGENLDIPGRLSVRTPMQWSDDPDGGFSAAGLARLKRRPPQGRFGPAAVNVADQRHDPESLLNWMERMIRRRRETPELGWGRASLIDVENAAVLAHRCDWEDSSVVAVHNFSPVPSTVRVPLGDVEAGSVMVDLVNGGERRSVDSDAFEVKIDPYGYRWWRVLRPGARPTP